MKKLIILLILFILIISLAFIPLKQAIVFQPTNPAARLAYIPINDESLFKIKYTHSIHLTDVVESYQITADQKIHQYELQYQDFAIGMPSNAVGSEIFEQKGGKYYIKNMKRIFPFFYLRIGQVRANHRVIFNNKEYPLSRSIKPGTSVRVDIRKLNFIQQWKGVNIIESL